jgi:uncharacterized damage-inducible protein DinB
VNRVAKLDAAVELLRDRRERLMTVAHSFQGPAFMTAPATGGWSVSEVIEHLALTESAMTSRFAAWREGDLPGTVKWTDRLRRLPPALVARPTFRVRSIPRVTPRVPPPRDQALAHIAETRVALLAEVERLRGRDLANARFKHPVLGALNIVEWLEFLAHHENRHRVQIEAIARGMAG